MMPGFDTTPVAAEVAAPQQNPFQFIGQLAQTQNALNQNKLFPLEYQAGQIANATNQQALQTKQLQTLQSLWASTANDDEMAAATNRAVAARLVTPEFAANAAGGNISGLDPASIHTLRQQALAAGGNENELGTAAPIQTGAGTQLENVNRVTNQVTPMGGAGAFVPNALGPKDLSSPVETVDENGTKQMGVMGDYVNADGSWKSGTPHPMTALGPLSQTAQASLGAAYGPQIAEFEGAQPRIANLRLNIENARQEADAFTQGPQSDQFKRWGEFLSQFGLPTPNFATMPQTAAREAFAKSLTQILSGQQATLHMDQTDAARQTAAAAVPSQVMTPEGLKTVFGIIEGNADAQIAMGKAWQAQKTKGGAASWGQFQTEFPNRVPPSIFQAPYMTPAQITDMQKGWSAAKKADWQARYNQASKLGWLPNAQ